LWTAKKPTGDGEMLAVSAHQSELAQCTRPVRCNAQSDLVMFNYLVD